MNHKKMSHTRKLGVALVSTVLFTFGPASAQDVVDQFADESEVAGKWTRWWGGAEQTYEFDATVDADKKTGSGSLKATIGFDIAAHGGDNQFSLQHYLDTAVDGTKFTQLAFDIRFDPTSPTRPRSGDFGYLEFGLIPGDYSQLYLGNVTVSATAAGWIHVTAPIDRAAPKLDKVIGITFKLWAGDGNPAGDNRLTGNTVFWVDNIRLVADTSTQPLPPPTLSVRKPVPGLQIFASKPGSQYQRQNIRTTDPSYSWVGSPAPVTYSFTIADYPDGSGKGFQTQLFLVPGTGIPAFETSPDYNEPDVIFVDLQNNADGSAYASFRHKIDQPNGNAMIYGDGTLGATSRHEVVSATHSGRPRNVLHVRMPAQLQNLQPSTCRGRPAPYLRARRGGGGEEAVVVESTCSDVLAQQLAQPRRQRAAAPAAAPLSPPSRRPPQ